MTDAAKPKTEDAVPNTAAPKPAAAAPKPAAAAAPAPAPCGCEERVTALEQRMGLQDKLMRVLSWTVLACAAAILYVSWTGAGAAAAKANAAK